MTIDRHDFRDALAAGLAAADSSPRCESVRDGHACIEDSGHAERGHRWHQDGAGHEWIGDR